MEVNVRLAEFKEQGVVKYDKLLAIPRNYRIPELIKMPDGRLNVLTAISASIKSAFGNINLKYALTEDQIVELSDRIIDSSHEDFLAIEDVLLFLQQLLFGEYGDLNYKMDMPGFFIKFEKYKYKFKGAPMWLRIDSMEHR